MVLVLATGRQQYIIHLLEQRHGSMICALAFQIWRVFICLFISSPVIGITIFHLVSEEA